MDTTAAYPRFGTSTSTGLLASRYWRVIALKNADTKRFQPNPLGDGFLTRNERYNELLWRIVDELRLRRKERGVTGVSEELAKQLAARNGRDWADMGAYERQDYLDQAPL